MPDVVGLVALVHDKLHTPLLPDEADTLVQAQEIADLLKKCGYETVTFPFDEAGQAALLKQKDDLVAVFNLVEMVDGRDDLAWQGAHWLEKHHFPYTGCPAAALEATAGKEQAKKKMHQAGITVPGFFKGNNPEGRLWILKSEGFHASRGMDQRNVSSDLAALEKLAIESKQKFGGAWFLEEYIPGREINMALLARTGEDPVVLPPSEITFTGSGVHIVDYDAKWTEGSTSWNSAHIKMDFSREDDALLEKLEDISRQCWKLFGLNGYARVDFRISPEGNPYVLEINGNPCLSSDAGYMRAALKAGLAPQAVIARILSTVNS